MIRNIFAATVLLATTFGSGCLAAEFPTCAQFRERLARAEKVFGGIVPHLEFSDWDKRADDPMALLARRHGLDLNKINLPHSYEINNLEGGGGGQLDCVRKSDRFLTISLTAGYDGDDLHDIRVLAKAARVQTSFLGAIYAVTWAYTGWSKDKVQDVVSNLFNAGLEDVQRADARGETMPVGHAGYDINKDVSITYAIGGGYSFMIDASTAGEEGGGEGSGDGAVTAPLPP